MEATEQGHGPEDVFVCGTLLYLKEAFLKQEQPQKSQAQNLLLGVGGEGTHL